MSIREQVREDPRKALFAILQDVPAGMLGVEGSGSHMQPMSHFPDPVAGELWFLAATDSDLVRHVGQGARAQYCVVSEGDGFYACLSGTVTQSVDPVKLEELWSPVADAWFPDGPDDPNVTLLRLSLLDADVWASTSSALKFGFEMAKAYLTRDGDPDVGEHRSIRFGLAA